jgi:hypothetical protein
MNTLVLEDTKVKTMKIHTFEITSERERGGENRVLPLLGFWVGIRFGRRKEKLLLRRRFQVLAFVYSNSRMGRWGYLQYMPLL